MAGRQFSTQTSLTSPTTDYPSFTSPSQVDSDSQSHLYALTRELDSLADSMYWTGHVIHDGYDPSADHRDDRAVPEPEMNRTKWNNDDENNMAGAGKVLETGNDKNYSGFPAELAAQSAEKDMSENATVAAPPPPPLPAPLLAPVPSTNFQLPGRAAKSFPTVKVLGARNARASRCYVRWCR